MRLLAALLVMLPLTTHADEVVDRVVDQIALPGVIAFADKTAALANAARADCTPDNPALRDAWNDAMDGWFAIQDLRLGPLEEASRRQAIAYWPDTAGHRNRALSRILSGQDTILNTPQDFAKAAVSVRGLYTLEAMLYDQNFNSYSKGDPGCALVQVASADLARVAAEVRDRWRDDFAAVMRTAGDAGNPRFLDAGEARQAIFTALMVSMQFDVLERLGLPLGTADRPRPQRAEGRVSGRSQRNLILSIEGHQRLADALVPDATAGLTTREDFDRLVFMVGSLDDPNFSGVEQPLKRARLEAVQNALTLVRTEVNQELATALGVTMGLNSLDGD